MVRGIGTCVSLTPKTRPISTARPVQLPVSVQDGSHGNAKEETAEMVAGEGIISQHTMASASLSVDSKVPPAIPCKEIGQFSVCIFVGISVSTIQ